MAAKYLVQIEQLGTSVPAMEGTAFLQEVELKNWRHPEDPIECDFIKLDVLKEHVLSRKYLRCLTPIGTIEFVEEVMRQAYGIDHIKPQNIPDAIFDLGYCGRRIVQSCRTDEILGYMTKWRVDSVFIKSAQTLKSDITNIYGRDNLPKTDELLFVSEPISIETEYRVFVKRNIIQAVKHYTGDPWIVPNENAVRRLVNAIGGTLPAYTLDVGVTTEGRTVPTSFPVGCMGLRFPRQCTRLRTGTSFPFMGSTSERSESCGKVQNRHNRGWRCWPGPVLERETRHCRWRSRYYEMCLSCVL